MPNPKFDRPDPSIPGDYRDFLLRQGRWAPGYDAEQARLAHAAEQASRPPTPETRRARLRRRWRDTADGYPELVYGGFIALILGVTVTLATLVPEEPGTTDADGGHSGTSCSTGLPARFADCDYSEDSGYGDYLSDLTDPYAGRDLGPEEFMTDEEWLESVSC